MGVLIHTRPMPPEPFIEAFRRLAPEEELFTDIEAAQARADEVEAVMLWRLTPGLLAPFTRLRLVGASAGGVDKIMSAPDRPRGVPVTRTIDAAQNQQIAQYVTLMVLRHVRQLELFESQAADRVWKRQVPPAPASVEIGLLGLGESAKPVAASLATLGFSVLGWSRSGRALPGVRSFAGESGLVEMLPRCQVLVCLLPLTPDTEGLIDAKLLARLPRGAFIVNVARGGLLVEDDLRAAIESGQVAGAALDVQSREPLPPEDPLWTQPRILITPHIASLPAPEVVVAQVLENLERLRSGLAPLRQVDEALGY